MRNAPCHRFFWNDTAERPVGCFVQAGKLVTRALNLEAEGLSGPAAVAQTTEGQGHAPMVTAFAARIERALRRREARAKATEQQRDGGGRFTSASRA